MGRGKDVAASLAQLEKPLRFTANLFHGSVREGPLRREPAVECQTSPIPIHQRGHVHDLRLKRIEAVDADLDQVIKEFVYVATGMDHHILAGLTNDRVHAPEHGENEVAPEHRAHLKATLLPPVVAEVDRIDVVFERFLDLGNVVVGDRVQELTHESRMVVEIHEQVLKTSQRPPPLVEGEADLEDTESATVGIDPFGDVREEPWIERGG